MADLTMAQAFLDALGQPPFIFQTFTDNKVQRKKQDRDPLARVLIGTLEQHAALLQQLSLKGAGVFVQINEADERGKDTVKGIRAVFLDLDEPDTSKEALAAVSKYMPKPNIFTQTTSGKYHLYWLVDDCPVPAFKPVQQGLAVTFAGDASMANLDRVMRLPGFAHQKLEPHVVNCKILSTERVKLKAVTDGAAKAPIMAATTIPPPPDDGPNARATDNDVFGLNIQDKHVAPTVLAPGARTQLLVRHIGSLVSQGFGKEHVEAEVRRMNIELCPEGEEPITDTQLELEVLGCIDKFIKTRARESAAITGLVKVAKEDAMRPPPPPPPPSDIPPPPVEDDIPAPPPTPDTNMEEQTLEQWVDRFLFISDGSRVADREYAGVHAIYALADFKNLYKNVWAGKSLLFNNWMATPLRQSVRTTVYIPTDDKIVIQESVKMLNTYCPSDFKAVATLDPVRLEPLLLHLKTIFPQEADRKIFTDWMVMTIRKPHIRIPWAPLLVSVPGAGKGILYKIMALMMGEHNCNLIQADRLENQFNSFLFDSTLVCIDEMQFSRKMGVSDKLKSYITEPKLEKNAKQLAERGTKVFCNLVIFSNHDTAAYIEDNDRRFWVYRWDTLPTTDYFNALGAWFEDGENIRHALRWVMDYDLSQFQHTSHPPMTAAKRQMIDAGKSEIELELIESIENREGPFRADVVAYVTVKQYLTRRTETTLSAQDEGNLRRIWARVASPLPEKVSRVKEQRQGGEFMRVKCIRNLEFWRTRTRTEVGVEATRAMQINAGVEEILPAIIGAAQQ